MGRRWARALLIGALLVVSGVGAGPVRSEEGPAASGQWSSVTLEPRNRRGTTVAVVGDTVLIGGGRVYGGESGVSDLVNVFDGAAGQWSTARLADARAGQVAATVGTRALLAGGTRDAVGDRSTVVDIYDSVSRQWSTATLSEPRSGMRAVTVGTHVVFAGGYVNGVADPSGAVDVYDSATGRWSSAALSVPRHSMSVAVVGNRVLFAGGVYRGSAHEPEPVDIFDADTGQWSIARLSPAHHEPVVVAVGSRVVFAGGIAAGNEPSDAVDVYDGATGEWSAATLSRADKKPAVAIVGSQVLLAPASSSGAAPIDVYDAATGKWSTTTHSLNPGPLGVGAFTVGTRALFVVGSAIDVYDSTTRQWSTTAVPEGRISSPKAAVGTKAIFVGSPQVGTLEGIPVVDPSVVVADVYDTGTGQWSSHSFSPPRDNFAVAKVGNRVLFAGGSRDPGQYRAVMNHLDAVDIYDADTGSWSTGALGLARETPRVERVGAKVLFIGGVIGCTGCPVSEADLIVDVYDDAASRTDSD